MEMLDDKPLVVISNKFTPEWGRRPVNYIGLDTLFRILRYLTPKYNVLYKRGISKHADDKMEDKQGEQELGDKEMIRKTFPCVVLYEDLGQHLHDPDDINLLLFGLMSSSSRFLSVQGGNAVVSSYFGGVNVMLIVKNHGGMAEFEYFDKFSNASTFIARDVATWEKLAMQHF